ncbi:PREDICTED: uncharacterized protein LOC109174543 [Ipomoea nil]|uniref:uncharacterized protein LOC109174543 n=1 Tax=Ipomoea nil TaxID=35883 RepID=UPI0009008A91|nr:PREDICTED: uncharacterized protein LOC109174543 [Ipomoea nil]
MVFPNFEELKNAVSIFHIRHRKNFCSSYKKSSSWRAVCATTGPQQTPCNWSLSAAKLKGTTNQWKIKKVSTTHTCQNVFIEGGMDRVCGSDLIAALVTRKICEDPHYKVKHIQTDVKNEYGLDVSYRKAWYARQKCIETEYGKFADSYNELPSFLMSLKATNPGTIIEFDFTPSPPSPSGESAYVHFKYAFWAFKPAIDGFQYCFPVIGVDGTHLYGKYKGNLLLAVGTNANNEIFPLAYSIVDAETAASWS